MRNVLVSLLLVVGTAVPAVAFAASVDSTLIPDGTYVVKVEKVEDAQHVTVLMQNGVETTLVAASERVDFGKVKPNATIKLSLIKGRVPVYIVQ